jgi:hypothetical protein
LDTSLVYAPVWHDVARERAGVGIIGMALCLYLVEVVVAESFPRRRHLSVYGCDVDLVTGLVEVVGSGAWFVFYTRLLTRTGER